MYHICGGKSYLGIDCSGLIQLIHQTSGQFSKIQMNKWNIVKIIKN